jgi:hypothetical protein
MEPLNDKELKQLLNQWDAPGAPVNLGQRVLNRPTPWWHWLLRGSIRRPAPVGIAAALLLVLWMLFGRVEPVPSGREPTTSTLADFQPVEQLQPTIVERSHEQAK